MLPPLWEAAMPSDRTGVRERVRVLAYHWAGGDDFLLDGLTTTHLTKIAADLRALLSALDAAEAERDRLREDAMAMTDGLAEILEVVNSSAGPLNLNATENDMWSEMYDAGLLTKFDAACDVAQRLDAARNATPTETPDE
jgi:hypothetical protein